MLSRDVDYDDETKDPDNGRRGRAYVNPFLKAVQQRLAAERRSQLEQPSTFARSPAGRKPKKKRVYPPSEAKKEMAAVLEKHGL